MSGLFQGSGFLGSRERSVDSSGGVTAGWVNQRVGPMGFSSNPEGGNPEKPRLAEHAARMGPMSEPGTRKPLSWTTCRSGTWSRGPKAMSRKGFDHQENAQPPISVHSGRLVPMASQRLRPMPFRCRSRTCGCRARRAAPRRATVAQPRGWETRILAALDRQPCTLARQRGRLAGVEASGFLETIDLLVKSGAASNSQSTRSVERKSTAIRWVEPVGSQRSPRLRRRWL